MENNKTMTNAQAAEIQGRISMEFNDLLKKVEKGKKDFQELIDFQEHCPYDNMRMAMAIHIIKNKQRLAPDKHYKMEVII